MRRHTIEALLMQPLAQKEIEQWLGEHAGWRQEGEGLARDLQFPDFSAAWAFMGHVADCAEAQDHHPNWYNVYSTVQIRLSSHDANGITTRDFRLAASIHEYPSSQPFQNLPATPFRG